MALCAQLGWGETQSGVAAVLATELATNLAKHAKGGKILMQLAEEDGRQGVELISLDRGPGMANPARCMQDGFSTSGSLGHGLGAILRQSSEFDLYSLPGQGTVVLSRLWDAPTARQPSPFLLGGVCLPVESTGGCGDRWAAAFFPDRLLLLVVDGLGHGLEAAVAAEAAVALFRKHAAGSTPDIATALHDGLRSTRGGAILVVELNVTHRVIRATGIGNITARLVGRDMVRHLISNNGTAGMEARKIVEYSYPWPQGSLLILHTDGVATHWDLSTYAGLALRHPATVAGMLWRDNHRGRDDATVLVVKERVAHEPFHPQS